jgi:hypothetical protein
MAACSESQLMIISLLRQSLGTMATFTGGLTRGDIQPAIDRHRLKINTLVFISLPVFDFAIVLSA